MGKKLSWTQIDPSFHKLQYLTDEDDVYYHLEYYSQGGYQISPANQWVFNYKKGIEHRGTSQWYYKEKAIKDYADLIINTLFSKKRILLLAGPPSKRPDSPLFDSRNEDVITTGSHFVVWRDLIHQAHPEVSVKGFYLARTVNELT